MFILYVDENKDSMLLLEAIDESFRMLKKGVLTGIRKPSMLDRLFKSNEIKQTPCLIGEGDIIYDPDIICDIIFIEPVQEPVQEQRYQSPPRESEYYDRFAERPPKRQKRQKKPRGVEEIPDEHPAPRRVGKQHPVTEVDHMMEGEYTGKPQPLDSSKLNELLNMPIQTYEDSEEYDDIEAELTTGLV